MPKDLNPTTLVLAEISKLQTAAPFKKYSIVTSSGKTYKVPTADHLTITRLLREVIIERDNGDSVVLNLLHVTAVERRAA